jgi:hypothetical protein
MQADAYLRLALGDALSVYANVGYRGQARGQAELLGEGAAEPIADRFISREHYVMYRPEAKGIYARAGRFFAPFGLRLAEHYLYVRRDLGYNLLQETYGLNIGYLDSKWELHVTGFIPDVVRNLGGTETGGAALFERRVGDASAIGLQGRYGQTDDFSRTIGGVFIKSYLESTRLLFQTELNVVHSVVTKTSASTDGFVGYLGSPSSPPPACGSRRTANAPRPASR